MQPKHIVYAPNYWQWFNHHSSHDSLPEEIAHLKSQLDVIKYLGLEVFSRNIYSDPKVSWFGGLAREIWNNVECLCEETIEGRDLVYVKKYQTKKGKLQEKLRYVFSESTLVQEEFLLNDYANQLEALYEFIADRCWEFDAEKFESEKIKVGEDGVIVAGEVYSPLKLLHFLAGPIEATYLMMDFPKEIRKILFVHEKAQLDLVKKMVKGGVLAVMAMDNLDTAFHPPTYVEKYSASFYEKASRICHEHGALFFIHACGSQRDNLKLISSLGVDGLEGVGYPPLGDFGLDEAMELTRDDFIITGGISAMETRKLKNRKQIFEYVEGLFKRMKPYANRFLFSAGCNTAIDTSWAIIKWFRDAWLKYG